MRLIYAGTPEFAVPALEALIDAGHEIVLVLTQPDRPAGRGMRPSFSAVKECALRRGLQLHQPLALKRAEETAPLLQARADAMIVAAYGLILPQAVLDMARFGALNIHASLLPRWRGAAPIQRAILAGDAQTGVCIMRMEAGLDTGPVLAREAVAIRAQDTGGILQDQLAHLGARMIVPTLEAHAQGGLQAVVQSEQGVVYAAKISKAEARIDWRRSAKEIERQIRAFNPAPGASAQIIATDLKIWAATLHEGIEGAAPGSLMGIEEGVMIVACGTGALRLTHLQRPGGKPLETKEFLRGFKLEPGAGFKLAGN